MNNIISAEAPQDIFQAYTRNGVGEADRHLPEARALSAKKFTHRKRPYLATCLQWQQPHNNAEVVALLESHGLSATPWGDNLIVRFPDRIDTLRAGMWIRVGQNGVVKIKTEAEMKTYEVIR